MPLHFASPWFLFLIPLGIAGVVWGLRKSYVNMPSHQRRLAIALRLGLTTLLPIVVAGPALRVRSTHGTVVLLVDVSASVPDPMLKAAREYVAQAWANHGDRSLEVVTFAGRARRAAQTASGPIIERHDQDDTDVAGAIAFARGIVPDGAPRIVLLSDGNDTHVGTSTAIQQAVAAGVELDVAQLDPGPIVDAHVSAIRMPEILRQSQPALATAVVESTSAGEVVLRLKENDFLIKETRATLHSGSQSFNFEFEPIAAGLVRYSAEVALPGDQVAGNDRFVRLCSVSGPPRVLLVSRTPEEGEHLEQALVAQVVGVDAVSLGSLPATLEGLLPYDAVILAGVPPASLDRLHQAALTSYVRDTGGGLLFISGRHGLQRDTSGKTNLLEGVLPVEMAAPSERQEPPVAMVLLVDRSGSMTGEKLDYAKQAAFEVIDHLGEHDQIGVIAFDSRFEWITPLRPVEDKEALKKSVGQLGAGGGTKFLPALEEAYFTLGSTEAALRHVVLLTDGASTDPNLFPQLLAKMRKGAVTVSTVAIGKGADLKLLAEIARLGGGRYSYAETAREVPRIFVKETETIQRDALQRRQTLVRVATSTRELAGIDFSLAPPLQGYVQTRAKAASEVLLETPQHEPLLARWRYGLGQVAAFTSDATSVWASSWIASRWEGFGKLWTQLVRGAQRPRSHHDLVMTLAMAQDVVRLAVKAIDSEGRFLEDLEVGARVIDGAQQSHEIRLSQVGPGQYAGELRVPPGNVIGRPVATRGGRPLDGDWTILARPYPDELGRIGVDEAFLNEILRIGGGVRLTPAQAIAPQSGRALPRLYPLGWPLTVLALGLFMADLVTKRARWAARQA
jgi:uncharacterized membrane protein/uncharacterized protein YegL